MPVVSPSFKVVKLTITYDGKPAIFTVTPTNRYYEISSPKRVRTYQQGWFRDPAPPLALDDGNLRWGDTELGLSDDASERAQAEQFVALYEQLRTGEEPVGALSRPPIGRASTLAGRAYRIADNVELLAWALLLAGLIAGALTAFREESTCEITPAGRANCHTTHPYIGLGIGLAAAALFQTAVVIMIASYIQARLATDSGDDSK